MIRILVVNSLSVMNICLPVITCLLGSVLSQVILEVTCGSEAMETRFSKLIAESADIQMNELVFNDPTCTFTKEVNGFYVRRIQPLNSCGTDVAVNSTHATFYNSISSWESGLLSPYIFIGGLPDSSRYVSISFECTYVIDLRASLGWNLTFTEIPLPEIIGNGFFQVAMAIYSDATYTTLKAPENSVLAFRPDEKVYVGIIMNGISADLYILMKRCWATPIEDSDSEPYYDLIKNSCPVDKAANSTTVVTQNGIGHQALWQSDIFRSIESGNVHHKVWLHCEVTLCINQSCEPICAVRRSKRNVADAMDVISAVVTVGPIGDAKYLDNGNSQPKDSVTRSNTTEPAEGDQEVVDNTNNKQREIAALSVFLLISLAIAVRKAVAT